MAATRQTGIRAVLGRRGLRRLLIGQAVSGLGDWVATLAFIALAFQLTHNQTAIAVVLVIRLVPPIFAAPVGGLLADRLDRRAVMVGCDIARAGLIVLAPFVGIALVYVIAFVHESISLLFLPARDASVPVLLGSEQADELPLANGLVLASSFGSIPFAAAVFGALSVAAGSVPTWLPLAATIRSHPTAFAFFFDAATFLVSAAMIAGIRIPRERRDPDVHLFGGLREAFRYMLDDPVLRSLSIGLVVSMFGGGVLFAIGIAYIHETLHGGDAEFGWLAALWGAGMALGLGFVRLVLRETGAAIVFMAGVTLCGAVLIVMAILPYLWLAFVMSVVFGAAFSMAIMVAMSMAQRMTEDRIRGRIMAGVQMLFRVGLGAGALGMGALAHGIGDVKVGIRLDGNQVGMLAGGGLILLGAAASSGILRAPGPQKDGLEAP
jgi:MFS family permease